MCRIWFPILNSPNQRNPSRFPEKVKRKITVAEMKRWFDSREE